MDAEQRETSGWMRRSWRSALSRLQVKIHSSPSPWLVVARGDGAVTGVYRGRSVIIYYYGHVPDDDAHVADVADSRAVLLGRCLLEAIQGEQPASQDGRLGGIRDNGAARSIEASH